MVYKVFQATLKNPINNDFVKTCTKYLKFLEIKLSFDEIDKISKWSLKKMLKENIARAAFRYLMEEKNKQSKIADLNYFALEMQKYLLNNENTNLSKLIFAARSKNLDIKTQRKWKYKDDLCVGCRTKQETADEIFVCDNLCEKNEVRKFTYNTFFVGSVSEIFTVAKVLQKKLQIREKILENESD